MSEAEPRRSRRSKRNVNYSKEQDFSDGDVFEDSPEEEPTPRRGRPKSTTRKSTSSRRQQNDEDLIVEEHDDEFRSNKPVFTEKGYDPALPPIRERFPFLPELEPDGSPRIDLIVGRRPVDEKGDDGKGSGDENNDIEEEAEAEEQDSDDEDEGDRSARRRRNTKKKDSESPTNEQSSVIEYEYLVKYKNRSYLHLEWKTGADLESMNKSAKTIYRRYLKKVAQGSDEDLENPEFDPSYVVPQKVIAEKEQEFTMELTDKELLKWEKEREKELAEESNDDEASNDTEMRTDGNDDSKKDKETQQPVITKDISEAKEEEKSEKSEENDWEDDIDFGKLTVEKLKEILAKEEPYYPVFEGCDNPYRDGYITEPPKKPRASYLFFQCTMRSYFAKRNPDASQGELMTILGDQWKTMSEEEQTPFVELSKDESKQYEKERQLMEKAQRPNEMWQPIRRCLMVLDRIVEDSFANIFLEPVNTDEFTDYDELIDQPMDLGTVRTKLKTKKYQSPEQFARDVRRVWNNCKIYNRHGSAIWHVADYMSKQFERLYHAWVLEFRERYLRWANPRARPWEHTCRQCDGKCGTPDHDLVLCDHCDAMYGYKCLIPPLKKLPSGVWHCPDCKPKLKSVRGVRMMSAVAEQAARKRAELGDTPKRKVKQTMYLVKWAGLGYEHCTWETKQDIANPALIAEFYKMNNSYPDEPDMPEEVIEQFLGKEDHINHSNAGGKFCIPDLRTQLYAQTRAFQFAKFGLDIPQQVGYICGPKSLACIVSPDRSESENMEREDVQECLNEMVQRVTRSDALPQLMEVNKNLPPLMAGEYDAVVPITSKGLMMNVGEIHGSVAFLGYRTFPDGSKGPAELRNLIRNVGDKIIAVDGVSTVNKSFKEVINLLRESGKNQFSFMRFLESRYAAINSDLTSAGSMGRYAYEELQKKFSMDRKRVLVQRNDILVAESPEAGDEAEESDASAKPDDSDDESDGSAEFHPDSDEEEVSPKEMKELGVADKPTSDKPNEEPSTGEGLKTSEVASNPSSKNQNVQVDDQQLQDDVLVVRSEATHSLAYRLLEMEIGYSSDEGGDEDCAFFVDGVDDTFTAMATIPEDIFDAKAALDSSKKGLKHKEREDEKKTLPVKRNEFSSLGDRAKLVASVALTAQPPDIERYDNFPQPSSKAVAEEKAKSAAIVTDECASPSKEIKRSTVKVEQIDVATNEIIHVWANAQAAAATLQIPLNELKQVLQGDYDEDLGDEVGGYRWRFAAAGATVTAGISEKKSSKKGKEAWLEFRDRLYDPNEPHPYKNGNRLRDYQVEGVNWLASTYYRKQGCILADEMGLGKTVQIVCYLEHLYRVEKIHRPFLVVVPLSTVEHWRREFEGWTDMVCCVYHDRQRVWRDVLREYEWYYEDRPHNAEYLKFDVLVTTYDTLIGDFDVISNIPFRVTVVDEAHRLRNQKGKLLECMREISAKGTLQYGFQSRVLMSGTPLQNDLIELWTLLNFIEPFKFPDLNEFMAQFGNMANREQVEALQQKISPYMLRRVKEDVAKDIPNKEETVIDVELTSIQKQYYRAIFEHNHAFLNMGASRANAPKLMNIQMELRKVCNHPCLLEGVEHREQDRQFKEFLEAGEFEGKTPEEQQHMLNEHLYIQTSGKMVLLDKLLPKLRQEGHKVLIFSQMVRMLDLISEYCEFKNFPYERLDGRVRGTDRQKSIDRFEREKNSFLFLLSTRAGGVGINLTAADICIIFDSDWNPQNDVQAQARCHRIGQTKDVRIYRLITSRSFEQEMFDRASKKLGLEQAVLGTFGQDDDDDKPTNQEMEQLLKRGAYALIEDENDEITKAFCADDIESILAKRTRTRVVEGAKTASWLNKQGMVVSKSKFTSDSKSADLDMDDPLFWQKVMPDFVTPTIMLQKLHDLEDEILGTTHKKKRGRGRGRWKKKEVEEAVEKVGESIDDIKPTPEEDDEKKDDEAVEEIKEDDDNKSDDDDDDDDEKGKFQLTRTNIRKVAKFVSDLKAMMEGIFDEDEDDALSNEEKATCQKLLLTISVKEKLFNDEQRHMARSMLKRLEGSRRRRCRTSEQNNHAPRLSPGRRGRQSLPIREELRIVGKKKKQRRKRGDPDDEKERRERVSDESDLEIGDDGYKVHSDDEADWSDIGEDLYDGKKRATITRKEAHRRRQWGTDDDAATAAGRTWPAFPRSYVAAVLGSLLDEVIKHDELKGGIFSEPVSREEFPEYYDQISQPMDYGTMKKKLEKGEYRSAQAMQKDFVLVMQNCLKFNSPDSDIVQEARQQALMRPNLLREAATKHGLFLAEDGSVLEILDDETKSKRNQDGTPKRRRRRKGVDIEESPGPKKQRKRKKNDDSEIEVEEEEDDVPLATMKKKKPRIKISLTGGDGGSSEKKRRRSRVNDQGEADADADVEINSTPIPRKKRGRPFGSKNKSTEKKTRKKKEQLQEEEPIEEETPVEVEADEDVDVDVEELDTEVQEEAVFLDAAQWKKEREALDGSFEAAKFHFKSRGAWAFPSELKPNKFKDVALGTLSKMGRFDRYSVFAEPVSESEAPGYFDIVKEPIDMSTMREKVENGDYGEGSVATAKFYRDFSLMFENCATYNDDEGEVIEEAARLFALVPETYAAQCALALKKQKKLEA